MTQIFKTLLSAGLALGLALPGLAQQPAPQPGAPQKQRGGAIKQLDTNKDGFLSREELRAGHPQRADHKTPRTPKA